MTRTEYLTGYKPEHYEPELLPLVRKRISDMRKLLTKLRTSACKLDRQSKAYRAITKRYQDVEAAIYWWEEILVD